MSLKTIGALLCGAVAFGAIQVAATPAKADKLDLILQRLDALEKENAALKGRLRRVEGPPAAPAGRAAAAAAPLGPQGAMARAPAAGVIPVKAPIAFVCDRYGPGFYGIPGIPGMEGCLKIGGYIRAQGAWGASGDGIPLGADTMAPQGRRDRLDTNDANYQARAAMSLDARVLTGWGELRGYARFGAEIITPFNNPILLYNQQNSAIVPNSPNNSIMFWDRGYIQFVGATIGKARSFFDMFSLTDGYLTYGNPRGSGDTDLYGVVLAGYTARFGDGFSASVSVEDPNGHNKVGPLNMAASAMGLGNLTANDQLGGQGYNQRGYSIPDVIGNLRVDQSWGFAGISAALHQVAAGYYTGTSAAGGSPGCTSGLCLGHPADKLGWAVSASGQVKIPGTLGDTFGANVVYSEGAVGFATRGALWQLYGRKAPANAGFGWAADGVFDHITPNCAAGFANCPSAIELTQAWSVNAAYQHVWDPQWKTSAYGSFAAIHYNQTATNIINQHLPTPPATGIACGVPVQGAVQPPLALGTGAGNSCSPNFSFWTVGSRTQYSPYSWLDLGVDVFLTHLNTAYKGVGDPALGTGVVLGSNGGRPAGLYTIADQNVLTVIGRAQINFNP